MDMQGHSATLEMEAPPSVGNAPAPKFFIKKAGLKSLKPFLPL